jgi:putative transposase
MADEETLDAGALAAIPTSDKPTVERKKRSPSVENAVALKPQRKKTKVAEVAPVELPAKTRRYSQAERKAKVDEIEAALAKGGTFKAAVKRAGVSEQTYYNWKRNGKANQLDPAPSQTKEIAFSELVELEAENQRLRNQLAAKLRSENEELRKRLNDA